MKDLLLKLFAKQFFIGIVVGFFITIALFVAICYEMPNQTDCDSCIEGTTP